MNSCRLCMKPRGVKPMNAAIVRKIEVCFGIHINLADSTLPRNICRRCTKRVNKFKQYRDFYLAVQAKLFIRRPSRFLRIDMQPLVQVILSQHETPRYIYPRTQPRREIARRRRSSTDSSSSDSENVSLDRRAQPTDPRIVAVRLADPHIVTVRRVTHSPRGPPYNRPSAEPTVPRQRASLSPVADRRPSSEVAGPSVLWHTVTSSVDVKSELSNETPGGEELEAVEQTEVSLSEENGPMFAAMENMELEVLETDVQSQGEPESLEDLTNLQEQQNVDVQETADLIPADDTHQNEFEDAEVLDSVDNDVYYQERDTNAIENVETTENGEIVDNVVDQNPTRPAQDTRRRRRNKISGRELYKSLLTECNVCGKKVERNRLEGHINRHSGRRPYGCPIEGCPSRFHCKHACRLHVRCRHGSETFACGTCGKQYKARRDLLGHIRETHVEPRFNCDICGKLFTTRSRLKQHRFYHTGERNFPCHVCEMRFYSNFQLKVHMRTHTKSFPFVCSVCNKCFRYRHMAKEHVVKDHGIDNTLQKEWVIQYPEPDPEEVEVVNTERNIVRYNIQRLEESEEKDELEEGGEGVTMAEHQTEQQEHLEME
ncbi:transcription factor E4F1-like [Anopheles marshallii]|uniref:transcription factor E4F1-like n=1 Tax=Anopheles marshallii TaxID=1521116 RepID=UPI00237A7895|nr:transcription factor E4F1-like [Anopheles marshallii]